MWRETRARLTTPRAVGEYDRGGLVVDLNSAKKKQARLSLIYTLIEHWRFWDEYEAFYLTKLAPALVADPKSGDETEVRILRELRSQLSDDEWEKLPQLIADRRAEIIRENKKEEQERARAAAEA